MSFTEEKRKAIIKYMLDKIRSSDSGFLRKTADNFDISETSVRRYVKSCIEEGILLEDQDSVCGFCLTESRGQWDLENSGLEEDSVYFEKIAPMLTDISANAGDIWYYAFTEIMNNAIEHSQGDRILLEIRKDPLYTEISITDNGAGIFRRIREYMDKKYGIRTDTKQAALELYKGKLTTEPEAHSGEGIFFVSKMLSEFAIWSENTAYTYRCTQGDAFIQSHLISYYTRIKEIGTMAVMKLDNDIKHTSKEIFDQFAPLEQGFVKTLIPVREMCPLGNPVARSQARRILRRLEEFREIIFDFRDIEFMGQGFADEVFRVFANRHPDITLTAVNANETVQGMIKHVTHGGKEADIS
ncbi:MAG TPA: DUF4325 domain-containing protein [Candidatus Mediterraneibacter merdavium]|nr:DUF4325 domain-containing protein [Candidatus Mediterraneibacter merdavium]